MNNIQQARDSLLKQYDQLQNKADILKAPELKQLYASIKDIPDENRRDYGMAVNQLRQELEQKVLKSSEIITASKIGEIDVTAPFDVNVEPAKRPGLLPTELGTAHPLMSELERVIDIFTRMGFEAIESRQLDNDWNMFGALNFPEGHPARDGYDTFRTEEGLIPPAHTSTMQNRILQAGRASLDEGRAIAVVSYGRCFRNEDIDNTHDHTFHQLEGVYVAEDATLGMLLGVLRSFFETYYQQELNIKTQPGYFPFTEPSLEFAIEKPVAIGGKPGDWLEMLGCGMIHPNVLKAAGIDHLKYRGFAWGGGIERLVMLAYNIDDMRLFGSGNLKFLRQFR